MIFDGMWAHLSFGFTVERPQKRMKKKTNKNHKPYLKFAPMNVVWIEQLYLTNYIFKHIQKVYFLDLKFYQFY